MKWAAEGTDGGATEAAKERKKALAGSVVKITARDVMLSHKIIISLVLVPLLWIAYALALSLLTDWQTSTKVLMVLCMPVFSYAGVMATGIEPSIELSYSRTARAEFQPIIIS